VSKSHREKDKSKYVRIERETLEEISNFLFQLGNQFVKVKNASGAFDCFKYSVDLNDKNQPSVFNIGVIYNLMGNLEGARRMFLEASRMRANDLQAKLSLIEVTRKLGLLDESKNLLSIVQELDPDNFQVLSAIAILEYDQGNLEASMVWNNKASEVEPNDNALVLNKALIGMTFGRWVENWSTYEMCLSYKKNEKMKNLSQEKSWAGQEQEGKTLLVISDQGSGDAIQFSRYLAEAKELGKFGKLTYLVQPDLKDILGRVRGVDEVLGLGENLKAEYDSYSSLLGIMRVLKISPENCSRPPHIVTDCFLDTVWEARIARLSNGSRKKVGIAWAGDPRHGNDHARSFPLSHFLRISRGSEKSPPVQGVQLFSFQVGGAVKQLEKFEVDPEQEVVDLGSEFKNFDDTASAMGRMDLVITCDTAIAHLAGCVGIPTWVLVPNPPEWRWLREGTSTVWYDSAKVYRQKNPRNWDQVFDEVVEDLHRFVKENDHEV
jgi:hypothetical protein